jgi:DNA repair exonuclease SbcCD nuclease subunit
MERKTRKQPTAILTGDWHLRDDQPTCRTDDFQSAQWNKVMQIVELQDTYDCPVWHSGDLFHHWKPSPYLLACALEYLPANFHTIYGNHDLPAHNIDLAYKCGINVLAKAERLTVMEGTHWGQEPKSIQSIYLDEVHWLPKTRPFLVYHVMTFQGKKPWPGCTDPKSSALLKKYPQYDLILTGHNHQTFVEEYEGRLLVNPGSLTRQEADKEDHKPCVFLYYAETNTVEQVFLPFEDNVISREHLDKKEERDGRINAFVSRLDTGWGGALSFEDNLTKMMQENKIRESVKEIINKAVEL